MDGMEHVSNQIYIAGVVNSDIVFSHMVYNEGFYRFDLATKRLSGTTDILPVTVSERLLDPLALPVGAAVQITGQIRSYNRPAKKLTLTVFTQEITLLDTAARLDPGCMAEPIDHPADNANDVYLYGYIYKPPIYRLTPNGRKIADLLVAVDRPYDKTDIIPCILWGRNARYTGQLSVGDNLQLWGRMQSRQYIKTNQPQVMTAYEVSVIYFNYIRC